MLGEIERHHDIRVYRPKAHERIGCAEAKNLVQDPQILHIAKAARRRRAISETRSWPTSSYHCEVSLVCSSSTSEAEAVKRSTLSAGSGLLRPHETALQIGLRESGARGQANRGRIQSLVQRLRWSLAQRRAPIKLYVGLDVGLEETSLCIVDSEGVTVREAKVSTEPEAIRCALEARRIASTAWASKRRRWASGCTANCSQPGFRSLLWKPGICGFRCRRCATGPIGTMPAAVRR